MSAPAEPDRFSGDADYAYPTPGGGGWVLSDASVADAAGT